MKHLYLGMGQESFCVSHPYLTWYSTPSAGLTVSHRHLSLWLFKNICARLGWLWTHCVTHAILKLTTILLPQLLTPKYWAFVQAWAITPGSWQTVDGWEMHILVKRERYSSLLGKNCWEAVSTFVNLNKHLTEWWWDREHAPIWGGQDDARCLWHISRRVPCKYCCFLLSIS